ncbi:MAG: hypothetical protein KA419_18090 [Acidobacteria bacterium]|nr:hypothetical protein [Acidobacteriota bacterium]
MGDSRYTCPCCGYRTFKEPPGSYEICSVCFWEDDPVQFLDPWFEGGANGPSLASAQEEYTRIGACEERCWTFIKGVQPGDQRDSDWRPVRGSDKEKIRKFRDLSAEDYHDLKTWYYWLDHDSNR